MTAKKDGGLGDALQLDDAAAELARTVAQADEIQLPMFREQSVFGTVRLPEGGEIRRTGPGRPRGSRNRTTQDLVKLIESTGRNPILAMAEIVATPIDVIAKTLKCKLLEAAEYHRKVMSDLAPYVAQKLPTAVQVVGANAGMLVINMGGSLGEQQTIGLQMALAARQIDMEQNQQVSEDDGAASHGEASHAEGK
jgi:hypothetical protein